MPYVRCKYCPEYIWRECSQTGVCFSCKRYKKLYAIAQMSEYAKENKKLSQREVGPKSCKWCNERISLKRRRYLSKFCSNKCQYFYSLQKGKEKRRKKLLKDLT